MRGALSERVEDGDGKDDPHKGKVDGGKVGDVVGKRGSIRPQGEG